MYGTTWKYVEVVLTTMGRAVGQEGWIEGCGTRDIVTNE
jgi:hypothetical protein